MLPFAGYLQRYLKAIAPRAAKGSAGTFVLGIIVLICASFVTPQHTHDVLGIRRLHEFLGRSAAGFLAIGMLCSCWCACKDRRRSIFAARLFWAWSLATLLPLSGACCSESLLLLTQLAPSWATPIRQTMRHSIFWHLGFWEWIGATAVFAFLCATVFLTPNRGPTPSSVELVNQTK